MKLTMKNIGVIRDAEIELDGITVLAGLNGSGKSTVSKALYGVMASYADLSEKIVDERKNSIKGIIIRFFAPTEMSFENIMLSLEVSLDGYCFDLANQSRPIPEYYQEWVDLLPNYVNDFVSEQAAFPKFLEQLRAAVNRPDEEYIQYLTERTMQAVFAGQINTIGSSQSGEISLTEGDIRLKIAANKVVECTGKEIRAFRPVYLDTRHVSDGLSANNTERTPPYNSALYRLLQDADSEPTFEEYKSRERVQDMIASVIHGKLAVSSFGEFMFKDDNRKEPISLRNVASGNKTFAVLQRLIENGALRENSVLIIDEPESNQHPEWQLKLAETLVLIQRELGVRIFLTTHSTYFLRAIEVYSEQYELSAHCHYYQTQPVDDAEGLFYIRNVDGNTKLIYHDFYMPLEEL